MCGAFAEFERAMIVAPVNAGLKRAKASGKVLLRPRIDAGVEADIRAALAKGDKGIFKIAGEFGVWSGTVQRIKAESAGTQPPWSSVSPLRCHTSGSGDVDQRLHLAPALSRSDFGGGR
jgi:DNA invertase Pin-like site-specific DNA recombinase